MFTLQKLTLGSTASYTINIMLVKSKTLSSEYCCHVIHWGDAGFLSPPRCSVFTGIVSLISLVILSYDRYSTLTVYNKQGPNYRRPLLAVGGSWLYSLFWTVPPLLGWSSYGIEGAGTSCSVSWTVQTAQSHAYIICLFTFCLGIPVLVMVYCYGRLLLAVKQVGRRQSGIKCFWLTDVVGKACRWPIDWWESGWGWCCLWNIGCSSSEFRLSKMQFQQFYRPS